NALTGSRQRIGNWPGVTVEKKTGSANIAGLPVDLVDLPGIYSLSAHSDDERVARDYVLSREASVVLDVVDASNLERNLFLTVSLIEMRVPVVVVLNMIDLAEKRGQTIDAEALSKRLGVPVIAITATKAKDIARLTSTLSSLLGKAAPSRLAIPYPDAVVTRADELEPRLADVAVELGADARWLATRVLEGDEHLCAKIASIGAVTTSEQDSIRAALAADLGDEADGVLASSMYEWIARASAECRASRQVKGSGHGVGEKIDAVVLNRYLGIPVFLVGMYLMFWIVINVGGSFIDFFDISFGAVFVDGFGLLLERLGSPEWLVAFLAGGLGAGIQTVATFVPIMFAMFFMLALLEDSGYMARAAFVMDRALRAIGLPGKAFIPMIVGFGCSVPAIMATRTLENKRDRYLTVFMVPFMSCGARLPVYALFGAAFFPGSAGLVVMSLYLVGIVLAVLTGLMLKSTLFKGEPSAFVMELPPYHAPRLLDLVRHAWVRLRVFVWRAGKVIVLTVMVLGILNSVGTDGSFGNEDSDASVLSVIGKAVTPVFRPMGISDDNWPATVGLFTGLFAKEAVVGTLNGLYGQLDAAQEESAGEGAEEGEEEEPWSLGDELVAAVASIGEALGGLAASILDPLGLSLISGDEEAIAGEIEADSGIFASMRDHFGNNPHAAYAYLLFVLIYFPCLAALGALVREIGPFFGWVSVAYLTVLAWISATLYYQITSGGQVLWIVVPIVMLVATVFSFVPMRSRIKT
ncbi:MAG: Fe(2+) transporter permease subunit FeoB, partial [Spirochaetales bacterium]|nr:Fe(2+) transporter permease subunit FeoB [Spirochaetales bacterium]